MKKALLSALVMMLLTMSGASGIAKQRKTTQSKETPDAEFKALIDRYYDAWSKLSTDAPAEFYAKDADCVFFDVAPIAAPTPGASVSVVGTASSSPLEAPGIRTIRCSSGIPADFR